MELPITVDQAFFLNTLGRTAQTYRLANVRVQQDLIDNLERIKNGKVPSPIRLGEAADLTTTAGQIDTMIAVAYAVFPFPAKEDQAAYLAHPEVVKGYIKAALTLETSDYILIKH